MMSSISSFQRISLSFALTSRLIPSVRFGVSLAFKGHTERSARCSFSAAFTTILQPTYYTAHVIFITLNTTSPRSKMKESGRERKYGLGLLLVAFTVRLAFSFASRYVHTRLSLSKRIRLARKVDFHFTTQSRQQIRPYHGGKPN